MASAEQQDLHGTVYLPHLADYDLAVALSLAGEGTHVGIAFLDAAGKPQLFHLAFHHRLRLEGLSAEYALCITRLRPERAIQVLIKCEQIWSRHREGDIPFGLSPTGITFNDEGSIVVDASATGLTCATFVSVVFGLVGLRLVDEGTWKPRAEDTPHQERLVGLLVKTKADESHVKRVRAEVGAVRIRPEEVAFAAQMPVAALPASLETVETPAIGLLNNLKARFPRG